MIFPENRVIRSIRFAQKAMPAIAVLAIVWQQIMMTGHQIAFAAAVLTALFALMIPLQGLWWLGKRSQQPLPPISHRAYQHLCQRLAQENIQIPQLEKPCFMDLALILKKADTHLPADFWHEL